MYMRREHSHKRQSRAVANTVQCADTVQDFSVRVGAYMVLVKASAQRHLNAALMRLIIADRRFLEAINAGYAGSQVDRLTVRVGRARLLVNIYPAGSKPAVVEIFHADAGYQEENRQKARDRWDSLYGDKKDGNDSGMSDRKTRT